MPVVHYIRVLDDAVLEVEWIRLTQRPGIVPPEFEQERLVERYTAPPEAVWDARRRFEKEEKGKEEETP